MQSAMAGAGRILFVSLTNDVGSDRVVVEAGAHGAACAVLGPDGAYGGLARCVSARFPITGRFGSLGVHLAFNRVLKHAVATWQPDWLVPLDDLAATLLRATTDERGIAPRLRTLVERSLGAPAGYPAACQRVALMETAAWVGVRTPPFAAADGAFMPAVAGTAPALPLMVKRDQSSGSGGVVRVDTPAQLRAALRKAGLKTIAKAVLARLGGFRRRPTPALLQGFVDGRLAMFTAACRDGQLIDGIGFEAVVSHPTKKASTVLRVVSHEGMMGSAEKLVAALGCSGFVSFDFLLDAADRAFLIEMNPRPIGSTHLGRLFGHDLMHAFLKGTRARSRPILAADTAIALFPKELERDPSSRFAAGDGGAMFDLPADEPAIVAAYRAHLQALHPDARFDLVSSPRSALARVPDLSGSPAEELPLAS